MFQYMGLLEVILLSLSILLAVYCLGCLLTDPLRHLPGPPLARFTRLWYLYQLYLGKFEQVNIKLHEEYGSIVRIAPGEYSFNDEDAVKVIYGSGTPFIKAPWYYAFTPANDNVANLFPDRDPQRHAARRRKVAAAYSMSSLVTYEPYVDNCTAILVQRFRELAQAKDSVNLAHWLQCYAFDVIGEIIFGERFGLLDMGVDNAGIFKAIDDFCTYAIFVGVYPWLNDWWFPLIPKTGGGLAFLLQFVENSISKRITSFKSGKLRDDGPLDFVSKFVTQHEEHPDKFLREDIQGNSESNVGAGSDTTASTLSTILYNLIRNPKTMDALRQEITQAEAHGQISDPVTFKETQEHLPYLQAVIKEAIRVHPAVGMGLQRLVPDGGANISGQYFPAGTTVGVNAWVLHRNMNTWGNDAKIWRPERWLEDGGKDLDKYLHSFGLGSRTCIGKNVSLLEMLKVVPQIVRKFDVALDESLKSGEWETINRWFVKPTNFIGRIVERAV